MSRRWTGLMVLVLGLAAGCDTGPKSGRGFTLPEGDRQRGQEAFVALQCYACHDVAGVDLPERSEEPQRLVAIGGEVSRIQTYGQLVTSIINPSHKLARGYAEEEISQEGKSLMTNYNDVMTVAQLIDLVAFLQSRYKLRPYDPTEYPPYLTVAGGD
ncbi:MAG: c-type cytochrome [Planctomycetales bacterium]|nr:c-type cytochrome [Planctomycetales bacterium]NIM08204.1 c-type cytochrome [Planctomycetales bacterium]NIN07698.1 c-type cytochrome [Planctomycetales bacterium]NIN76824.1 c-type cytochrome [Planctomycetales bacterium]NIO34020.1 c-type cytochrome [Planctomycetales bacterium]